MTDVPLIVYGLNPILLSSMPPEDQRYCRARKAEGRKTIAVKCGDGTFMIAHTEPDERAEDYCVPPHIISLSARGGVWTEVVFDV